MGLWAGHWHIQSDLCTIYNITLTSELSSVGIFLRYSTMPTIVHYSHFDRILGRQLKVDSVVKKDATDLPKEAFPSVPSAIHAKPVRRVIVPHFLCIPLCLSKLKLRLAPRMSCSSELSL